MTHPSRLFVLICVGVFAASPNLGAQGPRFEEEEGADQPKVPRQIGEEKKPPPDEGAEFGYDLAKEMERAETPIAKDLFRRFATPFDQLVTRAGSTRSVKPIPQRWAELKEPTITVIPFGLNNRAGKETEVKTAGLQTIRPYEEVILEEVDNLLRMDLSRPESGANQMTRLEQVEIAEKLLAAGKRFHQSAVEKNQRVGKGWEELGQKLDEKLREVRREELQLLLQAKKWDRAGELAIRLSADYPGDEAILRDIYRLQLAQVMENLDPDSDRTFLELQDVTAQYRRLPGVRADDPQLEQAYRTLRLRAEEYIREAQRLAKEGQAAAAQEKLLAAEQLRPDLPAIGKIRSNLKVQYPILYVGMAGLPENLSPTTAFTDAERRAVELIFEPLITPVPDQRLGRRFQPVLADGMPKLAPRGRAFDLLPSVRWMSPSAETPIEPEFDAGDVRGTIELLQRRPHTWAARQVALIDGVGGIDSPNHVKVFLSHGYLEPLAAMDMKILPARWLTRQQIDPFGPIFAQQPVGTGPYHYLGRDAEDSGRECAVFRANPYFGQRPGKLGRPYIHEIRFFDSRLDSDKTDDFQNGRLHILLDIPTGELATIRDAGDALVEVNTVSHHRRIHLLAVNHRSTRLRRVDLRRGIAAAIDRQAILETAFSANKGQYHRALNGPFPPHCWAAPETEAKLYDPQLARTLLRDHVAQNGKLVLGLIYPKGNLEIQTACAEIKSQIEELSRVGEEEPSVEIRLEALDWSQWYQQVMRKHDFDLAYGHFDYEDDLFRLDALFDREATQANGRNYMAYLADGTGADPEDLRLGQMFLAIPVHREFRKLREQMTEIHDQFNKRMPFIPLWHLDRHFAVHRNVDIDFDTNRRPAIGQLNPSTFFTQVQAWKLK